MRTTLTIDDDVLEALQKAASRARLPFKTIVNRALRLGLERLQAKPSRGRYRQTTARMGYPPTGNLDKALQLAHLLEDDEIVRKLGMDR